MEYYHHHLWGQRGNDHTFPETEILQVLLSHGNGKGEVKVEITGLSWDLEMRRSGFGVNQGFFPSWSFGTSNCQMWAQLVAMRSRPEPDGPSFVVLFWSPP